MIHPELCICDSLEPHTDELPCLHCELAAERDTLPAPPPEQEAEAEGAAA